MLVLGNLLLTTVGGYMLVGRYEVALNEASTELAQLEADLANLELELSKSTLEAEASASRLNSASALLSAIAYSSPSFSVLLDHVRFDSDKGFLVSFKMTNRGQYPVHVTPIYLIVSNVPIELGATNGNHNSYPSLITKIKRSLFETVGSLDAGEVRFHNFEAEFKDDMPPVFHYEIAYRVELIEPV